MSDLHADHTATTLPASNCPSWCTCPPGHAPDSDHDGLLVLIHQVELGSATVTSPHGGSFDADVLITCEDTAHTIGVPVDRRPSLIQVMDTEFHLTADQADRLAGLLIKAADRLRSIELDGPQR